MSGEVEIRGDIGAVAIGRNEGARLLRCLDSLKGTRLVYVDSGSTDDSVAEAEARGAKVVTIDMSRPFTAARARNAGIAALEEEGEDGLPTYLQVVDGDCEIDPDWLQMAAAFLDANPKVAAVCGRRRERAPEATVYNRIADLEWAAGKIGETRAVGGDAMFRSAAFKEVGGYNPGLIAGEEPELCVRLRQAGWKIWRLDAEMTLHDAAMTKFSQWWKRQVRTGYTYAEGVAMHGRPPEEHNLKEFRRTLTWGFVVPFLILATAIAVSPWALALFLVYPALVLRMILKGQDRAYAVFLTLGKFAEIRGVLTYYLRRFKGEQATLIEYK